MVGVPPGERHGITWPARLSNGHPRGGAAHRSGWRYLPAALFAAVLALGLGAQPALAGAPSAATGPVTLASAPGWPTLSAGQAGSQVSTVQYLLRQRGETLAADGDFGALTKSAVQRFQTANGLGPDGVVGPLTWVKLVVSLDAGATGEAVRALQTQLNRYGPGLGVDGTFAGGTSSSVTAFKTEHALGTGTAVTAAVWQWLVGGGGLPVAITDQSYNSTADARIRLYDPAVANWSTAGAQVWNWHPTTANGFSGLTGYFGLPTDAKLRKDSAGNDVFVVSDSHGLAALVNYPAGTRRWAVNVVAANNPHSVELLPDGNVAVAASTGGFVRVYAASQGSAATKYAQYNLTTAHGVLWDPAGSVLWAIGGSKLVRLQVGGTAAAPTLTEVGSWTLPTTGGHDLSPRLGNSDRLWVSTSTAFYEYSKSANAAVATYATDGVKSMNSMANGRWVQTLPKSGCTTDWCTDEVHLTTPDVTFRVSGAEIYKARVWDSRYQ
jgi:peptidoglycan hydrolase-like protein with peptidoglycan-binding domain